MTDQIKNTNPPEKLASEFDAAWKEALRLYFPDFIKLCWPTIYDQIDWDRGYQFLEQELQELFGDSLVGKRIADKIIRVTRLDGRDIFTIIHIEVQRTVEPDFEQRIFVYRYRIFDVYQAEIATLAVLIDNQKTWRPNCYAYEFWGTKMTLEYPILKILDFESRQAELRASTNPFAFVILAQLAAMKTRPRHEGRLVSKFELTKFLYMHGFKKDQILHLLRFLDAILVLSRELSVKYIKQTKKLEETLKMSFITPTEKMWLEQGVEAGVKQGIEVGALKEAKNLFLKALIKKFGSVPSSYLKMIEDVTQQEKIESWFEKAWDVTTIEKIFEEK